MVTLRRDVAVMQSNEVFDRIVRDQDIITDYDRFMQQKKKAESVSYLYTADYTMAPTLTREKKTLKDKKNRSYTGDNKKNVVFKNYDEYMLAQINRKNPDRILSEDEFKNSYVLGNGKTSLEKMSSDGLSKRAKIFIGIYLVALFGAACLFFFTLIG